MRRNDREITEIREIFEMLDRCTTISVGLKDDPFPYVVPMTFGCAMKEGKITVFFHCAGEGRKWDLLHRDGRVCVEAHVYERIETAGNEITAKYESVIGFGTACLIEDPSEKVRAMKIMLDHYHSSGFPVTSCTGMSRVEVYSVTLDSVTGKRNK